jgi:hypothetical protein
MAPTLPGCAAPQGPRLCAGGLNAQLEAENLAIANTEFTSLRLGFKNSAVRQQYGSPAEGHVYQAQRDE